MNIYREFDLVLDGSKSKLREYVWREPVLSVVKAEPPFYADTPANRAARYAYVVGGGADNPIPHTIKTAEKIKFHVRWRKGRDKELPCAEAHFVSIYVVPNKYTLAKSAKQVGKINLIHSSGLSYLDSVRDEIKRCICSI